MKAKIRKLIREAEGMPDGFACAEVSREAVRLADVSNDRELQIESRMAHLNATTFAGLDSELIVTFTWLLNNFGPDEDSYQKIELLWAYKWVLSSVLTIPDFSAKQVEYFLKDARKRYTSFSSVETRVLDFYESRYLIQKGNYSGAEKLFIQGEATSRDMLSDCQPCDLGDCSNDWFQLGDRDKAIDRHEALLRSRQRCTEQPAINYTRGSLYYALDGQWEKALNSHQKGYPKISRTDNMATHSYLSLAYKILAERLGDAVRIFDNQLAVHLRTRDKIASFNFFLAAKILFERYAGKGKTSVKLKSASKLPIATNPETGEVDIAELLNWLTGEITTIGNQFDQRNSSTHFHDLAQLEWPFGKVPSATV